MWEFREIGLSSWIDGVLLVRLVYGGGGLESGYQEVYLGLLDFCCMWII